MTLGEALMWFFVGVDGALFLIFLGVVCLTVWEEWRYHR